MYITKGNFIPRISARAFDTIIFMKRFFLIFIFLLSAYTPWIPARFRSAAAYFAGRDLDYARARQEFISPCGIGIIVPTQEACECIIRSCPALFRNTKTNQYVDMNGTNVTNDFKRTRVECIIHAEKKCAK